MFEETNSHLPCFNIHFLEVILFWISLWEMSISLAHPSHLWNSDARPFKNVLRHISHASRLVVVWSEKKQLLGTMTRSIAETPKLYFSGHFSLKRFERQTASVKLKLKGIFIRWTNEFPSWNKKEQKKENAVTAEWKRICRDSNPFCTFQSKQTWKFIFNLTFLFLYLSFIPSIAPKSGVG